MKPYQQEFIDLCIQYNALKFGEFTLKSGRVSPYFYNAAALNTGSALARLGRAYANAIMESGIQYDVIFGPAYKGIPLCVATSTALATEFECDKPYAFNRKEAKDHGEGGTIVGHALEGKILIIDDVITAGTAIRESINIIKAHHASPAAVVISFNREERGQHGTNSALNEVRDTFSIPVISIGSLSNLMEYLRGHPQYAKHLPAVTAYREQYGAEDACSKAC